MGRREQDGGHFGTDPVGGGAPTRFGLAKRKGAGWEPGYDSWGEIKSKDEIIAETRLEDTEIHVVLERLSGS